MAGRRTTKSREQIAETQFLNVDLDLEAAFRLDDLVKALSRVAFTLHRGAAGRSFAATLELRRGPRDLVEGLRSFVSAVERLPTPARRLWDRARVRDLNIGIQAGTAPHSMEIHMPPSLLSRAGAIGARIVVTVYAAVL